MAERGATGDHGNGIDYSEYELPDDLNAFQRDILAVVATLEDPTGSRISDALETLYRKPINDGRLYPGLDELDEMGLIDKRAKDSRTNEYRITKRGLWVIREYRRFIDDVVPAV